MPLYDPMDSRAGYLIQDTYSRQVITMKKSVLLLFIAALFLASCGLKAPPLPRRRWCPSG